jgi:hypothetical protein
VRFQCQGFPRNALAVLRYFKGLHPIPNDPNSFLNPPNFSADVDHRKLGPPGRRSLERKLRFEPTWIKA